MANNSCLRGSFIQAAKYWAISLSFWHASDIPALDFLYIRASQTDPPAAVAHHPGPYTALMADAGITDIFQPPA
jgi:hypothetical protein